MIRTYYQIYFLEPLAKYCLLPCRVSPNHVSILAMVVGLVSALCIIMDWRMTAITLLLLSGWLDTVDGTLARMQGTDSDFGCVLDIMSDRIVESAVIIALFAQAASAQAWVGMFMLSCVLLCVTSFLVVGIFSSNESDKGFHYSSGIVERFEAFLFFMAMIAWPQFYMPLGILFSVLVLITAGVRVFEYRSIISQVT